MNSFSFCTLFALLHPVINLLVFVRLLHNLFKSSSLFLILNLILILQRHGLLLCVRLNKPNRILVVLIVLQSLLIILLLLNSLFLCFLLLSIFVLHFIKRSGVIRWLCQPYLAQDDICFLTIVHFKHCKAFLAFSLDQADSQRVALAEHEGNGL